MNALESLPGGSWQNIATNCKKNNSLAILCTDCLSLCRFEADPAADARLKKKKKKIYMYKKKFLEITDLGVCGSLAKGRQHIPEQDRQNACWFCTSRPHRKGMWKLPKNKSHREEGSRTSNVSQFKRRGESNRRDAKWSHWLPPICPCQICSRWNSEGQGETSWS